MVTRNPRDSNKAAREDEAIPFPSEETTPPVTKIRGVMGSPVNGKPGLDNTFDHWSRASETFRSGAGLIPPTPFQPDQLSAGRSELAASVALDSAARLSPVAPGLPALPTSLSAPLVDSGLGASGIDV